jgi:hypothetical protein
MKRKALRSDLRKGADAAADGFAATRGLVEFISSQCPYLTRSDRLNLVVQDLHVDENFLALSAECAGAQDPAGVTFQPADAGFRQ